MRDLSAATRETEHPIVTLQRDIVDAGGFRTLCDRCDQPDGDGLPLEEVGESGLVLCGDCRSRAAFMRTLTRDDVEGE